VDDRFHAAVPEYRAIELATFRDGQLSTSGPGLGINEQVAAAKRGHLLVRAVFSGG
jgi:hypothetical protein